MSEPSRWARRAVAHVDARCAGDPLERAQPITFNFHPDRESGGHRILKLMRQDGVYRSQFETGTSNGGLTAHPGGARWAWEHTLFGGAYDGAPAAERPKYGALNHRGRPLGGAPRFGSAHLILREHMLDRATFCFPDSSAAPTHFATAHHFDLFPVAAKPDDGDDPLDGYVEAHVHGQVSLAQDVEALVADPCFRGTPVEGELAALGIPMSWHEGRVLDVDELQRRVDYRGPDAVRVGRAIARDGLIDAAAIGDAVRETAFDRQTLKQVWHLTAQWGRPRRADRINR
ncbi:DUF3626 domain-containing protein [Calidifontibacter terrae]